MDSNLLTNFYILINPVRAHRLVEIQIWIPILVRYG